MLRVSLPPFHFDGKTTVGNQESTISATLEPNGMVILKNHDSSLYVKYDLVQKITEATTPQFSVIDLKLYRMEKLPGQWFLTGTLKESLAPGIGEKIHSVFVVRKWGTRGPNLTQGKFWIDIE
jgi:hypothetical protein